jgi:NtrC-family two-component system sensor histidine kinase KinB
MEREQERSAISVDGTARHARLNALTSELNRLAGESRAKIAHSLFTSLIRETGAVSGRLFLADEQGEPTDGLRLAEGSVTEVKADPLSSPQEQALAEWAFQQRRGVLVADTGSDPHWDTWPATSDSAQAGSAMAVPILFANRPAGAILLYASQANDFDPEALALATGLADHAAVVMENTHLQSLVAEKQKIIQALRQSIHTINSVSDMQQVLSSVLAQMTRATFHPYGLILLQEEDLLRPVAAAGFAGAEKLPDRTFGRHDVPTLFQALTQEGTIVADLDRDKEFSLLGLPSPIRNWAITPLISRRNSLGVAVLGSPSRRAQDRQLVPTIEAFADYMAIAVASHRLSLTTDRRLRELAFLNESGQAITSTLDLERILHLLLERVRKLLQIDAASIALRDELTDELVFEAASGEGATDVIGVRLPPGQGIAGWVAETGKPLVVQDVYDDSRFFSDVDKKTGMMTHAILCIPIVLKGRVVGVIEALNPGTVRFDEQAIELLSALAGLAATAIDNARLFARVQSAEARYAGLFEDSADSIIITDLKGTIVDVNRNACLLFGQSRDALCGTNLTLFRSAEGNLDFIAPYESIQNGAEAILHTAIASAGRRRMVEIKGKEIQVEDTPLIQWIGRDISAEVELEQTREDMVRMIVHDLRNPLANIMNSLDVLYDVITEEDTSVSQEELLKIAKRSGRRLHQLISSILDISRLELGKVILETKPTELVPLLEDALEFIRPQSTIRALHITTDFSPNLPAVEIDSDMITRVVVNLLDNASKYTQTGGRIEVIARLSGAEVEVLVTDNGPGIAQDQLDSVFQKFMRVRRKSGPQGTGLGLAFCKLAVEAHGGRIWAESTLGAGSQFHFTLPVQTQNPGQS